MDAQSDKTTTSQDTAVKASSGQALTAPGPRDALQREQDARAPSVEKMQGELGALQAELDALQIEAERLTVQLESHQTEGQKRLAGLKAQWGTLEGKPGSVPTDEATREKFAERARVELESALMMDQEYRAQLAETEARMRETQQRMNTLRQEKMPADAAKRPE